MLDVKKRWKKWCLAAARREGDVEVSAGRIELAVKDQSGALITVGAHVRFDDRVYRVTDVYRGKLSIIGVQLRNGVYCELLADQVELVKESLGDPDCEVCHGTGTIPNPDPRWPGTYAWCSCLKTDRPRDPPQRGPLQWLHTVLSYFDRAARGGRV